MQQISKKRNIFYIEKYLFFSNGCTANDNNDIHISYQEVWWLNENNKLPTLRQEVYINTHLALRDLVNNKKNIVLVPRGLTKNIYRHKNCVIGNQN